MKFKSATLIFKQLGQLLTGRWLFKRMEVLIVVIADLRLGIRRVPKFQSSRNRTCNCKTLSRNYQKITRATLWCWQEYSAYLSSTPPDILPLKLGVKSRFLFGFLRMIVALLIQGMNLFKEHTSYYIRIRGIDLHLIWKTYNYLMIYQIVFYSN